MSPSVSRRTVTLRDGARIRTLRPIAPEDQVPLAAAFRAAGRRVALLPAVLHGRAGAVRDKRTSTTSRTSTTIDDHEAIVAVEPSSGDLLGVARYVRSADDPEVAELAVTVIDDWQGRGLGRGLLTALTRRARREGVRRFSAMVLSENQEALGLIDSLGDARRRHAAGTVELVVELPSKRGIGARLARLLREVAAEDLGR